MAKITEEARWRAVVHYRSEVGTVDVEHWVEELDEIHDLVERGPHWDTIKKITIHRVNHVTGKRLTLEQAKAA